ncbi:MAG TPA: nucleotidyl transferase AbiEii/AbiGii toxin family protein [Gemmatimonas sp.]|nr:nucleotidyl transferase AbiEii/AbiGii toxin family protein [Gemmatimonas sp.]
MARVCALLNAADARFVVVGATAMQLWGTSRATRDVDVLIEPTTENAARVIAALSQLPFGVAGELTPESILQRGVTMIGDTPNVDVLTRAWNVQWPEASRDIAVFEVEGVPVPTLSLELLIASKRTGRPQDDADILVLDALRRMRQ